MKNYSIKNVVILRLSFDKLWTNGFLMAEHCTLSLALSRLRERV